MKKLLFFFIWLLVVVPCQADIITVNSNGSGDYPTIQAAIDAASNGDVVELQPGTYTGNGNRDLSSRGKAITIRSQDGPETCIIDCEGSYSYSHRGFSSLGSGAILCGITITNGHSLHGGGIFCSGNPTITNCVIKGNRSESSGGGIFAESASPVIENCVISGNWAKDWGGGICCWSGNPIISRCTIVGNSATRNMSYVSGGGVHTDHGGLTINNCIIWGNMAYKNPEIAGAATVSYSDIKGGHLGEGNTDADPLLASDGYHILSNSPCINAGDPAYSGNPNETDIDGEPRVLNGRLDIGSDEVAIETIVIEISPTEFDFHACAGGSNPKTQTLSIRNGGIGTLSWAISEDCPWLEVNPINGESYGEINEVTLSVDISLLNPEVYTCELTITAGGAVNSPQMIGITLYLYEGGLLVPSEYANIQEAIDHAPDGFTVIIAKGTYTGLDNRDIDFKGKAITVRSTDPSDPNVVAATIIDSQGTRTNPHRGFYFHNGEGPNSVLAGLTITNGFTNKGGGIYCIGSSPTVTNCTISNNSSTDDGGGMYNIYNSSPTMKNCTFSSNSATDDGGGMCNISKSNPILKDCTFSDNSAKDLGGGIFNLHSNSRVENCTFWANSANRGGGIYNDLSKPTVEGCTFSDNSANEWGGGIFNGDSSPIVKACIFTGNLANSYGGGMFNWFSSPKVEGCTFTANIADRYGVGMFNFHYRSRPTVTNCIFWADTPMEIYGGSPIVTYSDVQGGWAGEGNVDADPLFIDPIDRDFRLLPDSPCIDAGDTNYEAEPNETDLDGNPRVIGGHIDMGAYETNYIEFPMKFTPQVLNPISQGKWVKAHLVLPEGFDINDVDVNSPAKLWPFGIESDYIDAFINEEGIVEIEIGLERVVFCGVEIDYSPVEVIVIGKLTTGQYFYGMDTIRIITNKLQQLAVFATHWLENGDDLNVDFDNNGRVDLKDFSILANRYRDDCQQ